MTPFTASPLCKSRHSCRVCRLRNGVGHRWRESLRTGFALPDDKTDFDCPHGKKWIGGRCTRCGGDHDLAACPIPDGYDGNYTKDSGGTDPCAC